MISLLEVGAAENDTPVFLNKGRRLNLIEVIDLLERTCNPSITNSDGEVFYKPRERDEMEYLFNTESSGWSDTRFSIYHRGLLPKEVESVLSEKCRLPGEIIYFTLEEVRKINLPSGKN